MSKIERTAICRNMLLLLILSGTCAQAEEQEQNSLGAAWDATINRLLAAGMYGLDPAIPPGLRFQVQPAELLPRGLAPETLPTAGQAITFSYEGSSGMLEFSAGFILTGEGGTDIPGTVFLDLAPSQDKTFASGQSWYMALDLSQSHRIGDSFTLRLGSKAMFLNNPFVLEKGQVFAMLFNMPLSYNNFFTISPELQWFRPLAPRGESAAESAFPSFTGQAAHDVFYGGISINFSY